MPPVSMYDADNLSTASFSVKDGKNHHIDQFPLTQKIGFLPDDKLSKIVEFEKLSDDMKHEIWYTVEEYDIIKARNSLIVKMMKSGNFEESDEHSFRGLEHKLRSGYKQRKENKTNAWNAVIEEQDKQFARRREDMHAIAEVYKHVTSNARQNAYFMGLKDAEESYAYKPSPSTTSSDNDCPTDDEADMGYGVTETDHSKEQSSSSSKKKKKSPFRRLSIKFSKSEKREVPKELQVGNEPSNEPSGPPKPETAIRRMMRRASM